MKLLILGSNGLLGNTFTKYFFEKTNYETYGFLRDSSKLKFFKRNYISRLIIIQNILDFNDLRRKIKELMPDVIINCIGQTNKIPGQNLNNIEKYINLNSLFPFILKEICIEIKSRLIHFSSDCVFSGENGFYSEKDNPDPIDIYGKSKLLGELNNENIITIRKSVIGHELDSKKGLLEWFLNQEGSVEGYKEAIFSGLTVLELARIIDMYILPNKDLKGIIHISGDPISKYDLLKIIANQYNKIIKIEPNEEAILITDQSVFYAESGGQVADTGEMTNIKNGIKFYVKDVQKIGGSLFCHRGLLARDSKALSIGQKLDHVVELYVDDDKLVQRIIGRFSCSYCGELYHKITKPPKHAGICDVCGSKDKFNFRQDDNEESLKIRLLAYYRDTSPLIGYYHVFNKLRKINGLGSVDEIQNNIRNIIK